MRLRHLARRHLLPLAAYLLIAIGMTYPLIRHLGTHLPGDGVDAWQNYWNFWWTREALAAGKNPYWTPLLYAPYGVPLYLHTLNPFNGLVAIPLGLLFGLTVAYNGVVFLSFVLAAYFAYLLTVFVCGSRLAGFAGGVVYAFGSYQFAHLLGHTNLIASEWLPAYILCLLAADTATGRRRTLLVLAGAASCLLLALCDWQYLFFAALFTALWVPWQVVARRSPGPLVIAAAVGLLGLLLVSPLLVPTIAEVRDTAATRPAVLGPILFSSDLLSFFLPSSLHSWWGKALETAGGRVPGSPVERAVFLGYLPLALAVVALWLRRRSAVFWAVGALSFAILALGPTLQIGGQLRFGRGERLIPLPAALLYRLPFVSISRVPSRFALLSTLCLAVLVGLGLVGLSRRFGPRLRLDRPLVRVALTALLLAGLLVEHLAVPYPLSPVRERAFYRQLARSPERGAIVELPLSIERPLSLYGQTVHGRRLHLAPSLLSATRAAALSRGRCR